MSGTDVEIRVGDGLQTVPYSIRGYRIGGFSIIDRSFWSVSSDGNLFAGRRDGHVSAALDEIAKPVVVALAEGEPCG